MTNRRLWLGLSLAAALVACGVPQPQTGMHATGPAVPADGVPQDRAVYPGGNPYRVLALEELPIASVAVDSSASGYPASNIDDGNLSTEWSNGGYRNPTAWAAVQLGTTAALASIAIKTGPSAAGTSYDVQVSDDGAAWSTVLAGQTNTSWNLETKTLPAGTSGRWIRVFWHNNPSSPQPHFAIFELAVNGTPGSAPSPTPSATTTPMPTPTPTASSTPSPAPSNAPSPSPSPTPTPAPTATPGGTVIGPDGIQTPLAATASSSYSGLLPARAIDGDDSTQWASGGYRNPEDWLALQFRGRYHFDQAYIKTGSLPAGVSYRYEVSDDGVTWTPASGTFTQGSWYDQSNLLSGDGRYLRVHFFNNPTAPIARFQVYTLEAVGSPLSDGNNIALCTADGWQENMRLAFNPKAGEYLMVWTDYRKPRPDSDVWLQRMRADGTLVGDAVDLTPDTNVQDRPDVVYNPTADEYLVVWRDNRAGSGDLWAQRIAGSGQLIGGNFPISENGAARAMPRLAYNSVANEYLVVWTDFRAAYNDDNVYAHRLNAQGTPVGDEIPICELGQMQTEPHVAFAAGANRYLVAWNDERSHANVKDIYGQVINGDGSLPAGNFPIDTSPNNKGMGDIGYNWKANEYALVWTDSNGDGTSNIMTARSAPDGTLATAPHTIWQNGYQQYDPSIAYNGKNDEYLVAWAEANNGYFSVQARHMLTNTNFSSPVFALAPAIQHIRQETTMAFDYANDQYFIGWTDFRNESSPVTNADLYGQFSW